MRPQHRARAAALIGHGRLTAVEGRGAETYLYVGEGMSGSPAVSRDANGILSYHNAGKVQASSQPQDMRLQRMLGHLTTLVPANPQLGAGRGVRRRRHGRRGQHRPARRAPDHRRDRAAGPERGRQVLRRTELQRRREPQGHGRRSTTAATSWRPARRSTTRSRRPVRSLGQGRGQPLHEGILGAGEEAPQPGRRRHRLGASSTTARWRSRRADRHVLRGIPGRHRLGQHRPAARATTSCCRGRSSRRASTSTRWSGARQPRLRRRSRVRCARSASTRRRRCCPPTAAAARICGRGSRARRSTATATCGCSSSPASASTGIGGWRSTGESSGIGGSRRTCSWDRPRRSRRCARVVGAIAVTRGRRYAWLTSPASRPRSGTGPVAASGWVLLQDLLDRGVQAARSPARRRIPPATTSRVLDVGCGTGGTTLAAARRLGARRRLHRRRHLGADDRRRASARGTRSGTPARFIRADAQDYAFEPASFDAIISRFGVMFFDDPVAAFANLRRAASAGAGSGASCGGAPRRTRS